MVDGQLETSTAPRILVTGGAGYVGSVLVPKLLSAGYRVRVLDLFLYGESVLDDVKGHPGLELTKGDIRDRATLEAAIPGYQVVIHLACVSNDPSFELNPELGKTINYDAFRPLVEISRDSGVERFIYASSSSVYGIKEETDVTEELSLQPLTDYSKYKAACEDILRDYRAPGFVTLIIRPATVCGYSPRLRLDLTVNIMTNHAVNQRAIKVFGGTQMRPNIHIEDMADLYVQAIKWPSERIDGQTYNAGYQNLCLNDVASLVRGVVGPEVDIVTTPTNDNRSYHISSEKIRRELGFVPRRTVEDAVKDIARAFRAGKIPDSMNDDRYYNVRRMQRCAL
ncbi:MAG: NAD-dependent epimerase/dehydratase family protein [Deltaproteobacteria bacterium]|nr:NAD-dependent epimerase/dehydratase family protein [Deltaproteobacteria bacterium]